MHSYRAFFKFYFFILCTALSAHAANGAEESDVIDRVAAVVNGEIILLSDVDENMELVRKELEELGESKPWKTKDEGRSKTLDQMINDRLIFKEISRRGLEAGEAVIDGAVVTIMKQNGFTSRDELKKVLKARGLTFEEYRKSLKKQIESGRLMNEIIKPKVQVSDTDILAAYRRENADPSEKVEYHIQMIFKSAKGASLRDTQRLRKQLDAGIPFETIAKRETDGPAKDEGGDIGFVVPSQLKPELAKAIESLKAGDISDVISTKEGHYIVRLVKKRTSGSPELSETQKNRLREQLVQRETERQFDRFVRDLRDQAQVEVKL